MKILKFIAAFLLFAVFISPEASFANDTLSVIHSRKSVRNYTKEPVSKDDLMALVKAGMAAPSAMDKRPWTFVIITGKDMLNKLADGLPYGQMLKNAGAAIVVCGKLGTSLPDVEEGFWIQDCSAASENILLAAESLKLGAVWIGVYPNGERIASLRSILGIPEQVMPLNVISIGYPAGVEKPKDKFDIKNIHWEKW